MMQYSIPELDKMYRDVKDHVSKLMEDNKTDWEDRYRKYLEVLAPGSKEYIRISRLKDRYGINRPITRYLSISYVHNASANNVVYDLRVYGHSIGNLVVKINREISSILDSDEYSEDDKKKIFELTRIKGISKVVIKKTNYNALRKIASEIIQEEKEQTDLSEWINKYLIWEENKKKVEFDWDSVPMTELRSCMKAAESKMEIISEHSCENLLLKALSSSNGDSKYLKYIQPIQIGNSGFFQMPTCLKGSEAKKSYKKITYSKQNGGGIDILARIKKGKKAELCVIELKDEYLYNERPVLALKQAIAYAVCLDYIMRSENVNADKNWYNDIFMPDSKVNIGESININVVAAMPFMDGAETDDEISDEDKSITKIEPIKINVLGHNDTLTLHYMFFKKEALKKDKIENGIITSLPIPQPSRV